jgi:signal transduction histidine kinase
MKLQTRLLLATAVILTLLSAVTLWISHRAFEVLVDEEMAKEARNIRAMLMATRRVYHKQFIDSGLPVTDKTVGFLPAHALARISQDFPNWATSGLSFNNVSDRPRNPVNRADADELNAMDWFRANPQAKEHIGEIKGADGKPYYHYTTPMWIEEYCLKCHGQREKAPASIQRLYTESFDYQVNELRGVMSIKIPLTTLREQVWSMWRRDAFTRLVGYVLLFLALAWVLRRTVTLRLSGLETTARQLTAGDYKQRTSQSGTDEIGTLATALNQMANAVEKRDTELRRFSEITAHHLQEPARRMASFADRLGKQLAGKLDDPEAQLSLDFIGQQARHQQNMLRDVERYLAADQPRGELAVSDARQTVTALLARAQDRISAAGAKITVGELPPAWIDAPRLADLFEIVLGNALQHGGGESRCWRDGAPEGNAAAPDGELAPPHITINGERVGSLVRYCVSDNGPGIEAQYRERVFRAFERLKSGGAGTGIGLAIVRRIAESCGGRAWVEETPGGGCSVRFEIPTKETP